MASLALALSLLVPSSRGYREELLDSPFGFDSSPLYGSEEAADDADFDVERRNENFMRFGRSGGGSGIGGGSGMGVKTRPDFDDTFEDFARPTRSGHLERNNENFIRFGRSRDNHLRFGRNYYRASRAPADYLRFGRSVKDNKRSKREAYSEFKRGGNSDFVRFGRNSNFLRFGRTNPETTQLEPQELLAKIKQSPLIHLLSELIENVKKEQQSKCSAASA